ncbi:vacuolar fusion protein CCZ1 homolog [Hydra vulgaris]|uniref:Vacuolar fusion protein CCZ1 homolog n=1 Tax=Hydra vulgaris TaxID=6087 RepID=A0ABM4C808_HYDVU
MSQQRSSLLSFFIYNTDYGNREGYEEEKILLYIPQEDSLDRKVKTVGLCQALSQFVMIFNPSHSCEIMVTQKMKQYFLNPEKNFWIVLTLSIPFVEKMNKDKIICEYLQDEVQDSLGKASLQLAYDMFVLFNGTLTFILNTVGLELLKERLEYFYTRYLQTLNFGQLDILDVYQGITYLPLNKNDFLKVNCFSNLVEATFKSVRHVCLLYDDQLIWTTLNCNNLKILYKYLTSSLLQPSAEDETIKKLSPNTSLKSSPNGFHPNSTNNYNVSNSGRFVTGFVEIASLDSGSPKRAPRVFVDVNGLSCELNLIVYKACNLVFCLIVDLQSLNSELCTKIHKMIGPQLSSLSNVFSEQVSKRSSTPLEQQFTFVYFNSMNLAIKSSIYTHKSLSNVSNVSPDVMQMLIDLHEDFDSLKRDGEIIAKYTSDWWIVGKRSKFREFFVVLNKKNATIVEINEEVSQLISSNFSNIYL